MNTNPHLHQLQQFFPGRTALRPREVCDAFGFGMTYLYSLFKANQLTALRLGGITLVPLTELAAWMDRSATEVR